ncbi:MAG: hypothetical protein RLZZ464_1628 [Pseudomonadota bacterium]|jgi:hypothetical protein
MKNSCIKTTIMVTLVCRSMLFPGIAQSQYTSTAQAPTSQPTSYTATASPTSSGTAVPTSSGTAVSTSSGTSTSTANTTQSLANPVNPSNALHISNPSSPTQLILRQQIQTTTPLGNSKLDPMQSQAFTTVQAKSISELKFSPFSVTSKSDTQRMSFITLSPFLPSQKIKAHSSENHEKLHFFIVNSPFN